MNNCNCNNNDCGCVQYNGGKVLYTGVNITTPFTFPRGSSFNEFVTKVTDYLKNISDFITVTYTVNPSDATILINGEATNSLSVPVGSNVNVVISQSGYETYTDTFTAPLVDTTYNISLTPLELFNYYWGEIGNIFAPSPNGISQSNWNNLIKPDGTSDNMDFYEDASSLDLVYEKESTGSQLQWWIILVPTSKVNIVNDLANYSWKTYNNISGEPAEYTGAVSSGTVVLDSISYTYRAIRPLISTKIQFSKNAN